MGPGLAELLTHQVGLDEAIQAKPIAAGGNGEGGGERRLDVVTAGARMGQSTSDSAERLREQLGRLEAPVLGIVANAIKVSRGGKYGYGNYGGYYAEPAEQGAGAEVGGGGGERA